MPLPNRHVLAVYTRLQTWRRRERARWPGLFHDSLTRPPGSHTAKLQIRRSGSVRLLIDDIPILICDACGALLKRDLLLASSDSTQPPPSQGSSDVHTRCPVCAFTMPLEPLRCLMGLPPCGPDLHPGGALALYVEALGAKHALKQCDESLHPWILDLGCRLEGLDALMAAIGIREEQVTPPAIAANPPEPEPEVVETAYMLDAERFFKDALPTSIFPDIPFSIADVRAHDSPTTNAGRASADRAADLVAEAARIWRTELCAEDSYAAVPKVRGLGQEFMVEQMKARAYNHLYLTVPETIRMTQPGQTSPPQRQDS